MLQFENQEKDWVEKWHLVQATELTWCLVCLVRLQGRAQERLREVTGQGSRFPVATKRPLPLWVPTHNAHSGGFLHKPPQLLSLPLAGVPPWWILLMLLLSRFSCIRLCATPSGSSVHGSFQARVLEWGAIAFSNSDNTIPEQIHFLHSFRQSEGRSKFLLKPLGS